MSAEAHPECANRSHQAVAICAPLRWRRKLPGRSRAMESSVHLSRPLQWGMRRDDPSFTIDWQTAHHSVEGRLTTWSGDLLVPCPLDEFERRGRLACHEDADAEHA